jgi:hypothetical protein
VPGNDSTLPTAHYAVGTDENCLKNIGEKGLGRTRTAQNTQTERLERGSLQPEGGRRAE